MPIPKGSRKTRSDKGKRRGKKVMHKTTPRGAYKSNIKNQMALRRAPIVETKQRVHSDIATLNGYLPGVDNLTNPLNWRTLVTDDAFTNIPLLSWCRNTHGFQEYNVIGNSIFSKFLNVKFQLRFPRGEPLTLTKPEGGTYTVPNNMIQQPTKVYLVTGWITTPMNYPLTAAPSPSLPAQADADGDALGAYITQQLKPFFDDDEDKLQFRPKATTNIKIDKYMKLTPNLGGAIGTQAIPSQNWRDPALTPAWTTDAHGSIPDVMRSWHTKTNRKIVLTQGQNTSFPVDSQNLFPNNSWVPFCVVYNPDYQAQQANTAQDPTTGLFTKVQMMEYRWNDVHYFTDS